MFENRLYIIYFYNTQMNSPPNYSPSGHFCCMDPSHGHVYEGNCTSPLTESCHFVSYDPQTTENPLQATAAGGLCSCANPDGIKRFSNINYTYSDRIPANSYAAYRPSGVYSPPPGYPWFPCMNAVRWDPFSYSNNNNLGMSMFICEFLSKVSHFIVFLASHYTKSCF